MGGFSEEFYPGTGSDPDLNIKLWNLGVRIFKGINNCKVYHFGSIVTRKYKNNPKIITELVVKEENFSIEMGYYY